MEIQMFLKKMGSKLSPRCQMWNLKLYAGIVTTVVLLATSFSQVFCCCSCCFFYLFLLGVGGGGGGGEGGRDSTATEKYVRRIGLGLDNSIQFRPSVSMSYFPNKADIDVTVYD